MGGAARCRGGREVWILPGGNVLVAPGKPGGKPGGKTGGALGNQVEQLLQTGKDIFSNCGGFNCCASFELALQDEKKRYFWYFFSS